MGEWSDAQTGDADRFPVIRLADGGLMAVFEHVQRGLGAALDGEPDTVVLDLAVQPRATPTAVAAVAWVARTCGARGVRVVLASPSPAWIDVLRDQEGGVAPACGPALRLGLSSGWPPLPRGSQCGTW